jgi:predicted ribosome quality control (RQC) complex YloA/Tae2 family protein
MLTDWVLTARLGHELEERLRGARFRDAGLLDDGRIGLLFRSRGAETIMAVDLFASPPLITLEPGELAVGLEPGFIATLVRSLRDMTLDRAWARRGDRLLRLTFAARSRFGVDDRFELYIELVPRFGNLVLVKGERVVAALKEFSPAANPRRAVQAGQPYALPPLPPSPPTLAPIDAAGEEAALRGPLYVYRRDGRLVQAYVAPLDRLHDAQCTRDGSLLAVFAELRAQQRARGEHERSQRRRLAVAKRLSERERKLRAELAALDRKQRRAETRDELRREGERIFATLHELGEADRAAAKERAGELFDDYKRLGRSVAHIASRRRSVDASLAAVETLRWESERASDEDLGDVETALAQLEPNRSAPRRLAPTRKRKRAPLEFRTAHGSRILVGRSPIENAELTFRVARPNDLWFHAQGTPGAHVILSRDGRAAPAPEDLQAAAALAAFHSKAKGSATVAVDYTLRKHVRKQRAAPPGLVWYTHAKTLIVEPGAP